jgi:hypothetical protein
MQQFDRSGCGVGHGRMVVATSRSDRQAKPGTYARAAREHSMAHRRGEARWRSRSLGAIQRGVQSPLDSSYGVHCTPPQGLISVNLPCHFKLSTRIDVLSTAIFSLAQ